jgi:Xaa-Pro aminopeptidase
VRKLQFDFASAGVDALLVTSLHDVRYLTGFTGSNGACLVLADGRTVLFTDPRYTIQAGLEFRGGEVRIEKKTRLMAAAALEYARKKRLRLRIGFDPNYMTVAAMEVLAAKLPAGCKLVPQRGVVEAQRMVKDEAELAAIRRSVLTNSAAFEAAVARIRPEMRESDLAAEIEYQQRLLGASGPAFETIVASGARTALPHARPTDAVLGANVVILIDVGAVQDGYTSDMTRMLALGSVSRRMRGLYKDVLEAQLAAIDAVREGVGAGSVDRAARNVLKAKGLSELFTHSTGHGLGLEVHESPGIRQKDKTKLRAGMVVTIEPGIYIEGLGGIRIEDTVAVTSHGCEILTPTSKEFKQI